MCTVEIFKGIAEAVSMNLYHFNNLALALALRHGATMKEIKHPHHHHTTGTPQCERALAVVGEKSSPCRRVYFWSSRNISNVI